MGSLYIVLSTLAFFFAPHILSDITSYINGLLNIELSGWVYWFIGLIIIAIVTE